MNLERLARWAEDEGLTLPAFRVRHLREYIAVRAEGGQGRGDGGRVSERTLRHDAICVRVFLRFYASESYVPRDPLTGDAVAKAPCPFVKCPSVAKVFRILSERYRNHRRRFGRRFNMIASIYNHELVD